MGANKFILAACMAAMGAVVGPIDTADYATLGDSITEYANIVVSVAGATVSRDTTGLVTIAKTGIGASFYGRCNAIMVNVSPSTLNVIGDCYYGDANTAYIQTTVTGAPLTSGAITLNTNCAVTLHAQSNWRGIFPHVQSLAQGGLKFQGNFGMQGDTSEQLLDVAAKAAQAVRPGHFVQLMDGVNNIAPRGSDSTATAIAARKALIDEITSTTQTGGARVAIVCATMPVGTATTSYATINANIQTVNTAVQAYCDGVTKIWVDTFTPFYDGTSAAYSWATVDGVHPPERAAAIGGAAIWSAISSKVTTHALLPIAYNTVSPVPFATNLRIIGPYTAAPGWATVTNSGFYTGGSGTRPSAGPASWTTGRQSGSATAVMSIVADPGDSKGQYVQVLHTPNAAGDKTTTSLDGVSGVSMTTLGLSPGDRFVIAVELTWSSYTASNCNAIQLTATASTFFNASAGTAIGAIQTESGTTIEADSATKVLVTGVMTVPASAVGTTTVNPVLTCQFSAASATPLTTLIRRVAWIKVSGTA